jgi:hypothetical protein
MKRLIVLAMIAGALMATVPSHAEECVSGLGTTTCAGPWYVYEACASTNPAGTYTETCTDVSGDASYGTYLYGYGTVVPDTSYYFNNSESDGQVRLYDDLAVTCFNGGASTDLSYHASTC